MPIPKCPPDLAMEILPAELWDASGDEQWAYFAPKANAMIDEIADTLGVQLPSTELH